MKILAAKRLVASLGTVADFEGYIFGHPKEFTAFDSILDDIERSKHKENDDGKKGKETE